MPSEWPEDIRWIVEAFRETEAGKGKAAWSSPRFYVANGRKLVVTAAGHAGWNDRVQPVLRKLTGS